ncbi:tryptophan--tRNA ligase [Alphaproteobacteria bacterium]|jgi:tryptophanyl-tRNA synthetase|nr:tryptophan--tRNA ligase [Alphaproteobacteria bacterium]MBT5799489.1 tryptophan--tRNA ligase [Alphaproteobacteria bacterium]MDA9190190.1 tryptophan--tRNA ligase [Alphaproteobacteria bacterium]MDC3311057.1 tryptophan--tRNA ligase [Alphaproteobacteria bacterium]
MSKGRVFSGVQPTGNLHLGNYLGAIKNWVGLQQDHETIYCIVDLHAITVPQQPQLLKKATQEVAACLIASGIDTNNSILFNQSQVSQHAELAWLFNCVARLGWLNRMTQFKEKAGKNRENATVGLYAYPTLMAADILAYKATHVPVGDDQKQHLELTRDIATAFNSMFGEEFFPLPEPVIQKTAARIMSLRDGSSKMSKSDDSDFTRINLNDEDDLIAQKIKKAKTDPEPLPETVEELENRPEARNLVGIYAALTNQSDAEVLVEFSGQGFGKFKPILAESLIGSISPIRTEMNKLLADTNHLDNVLSEGSKRAAVIAEPILRACKNVMGFVQSTS